MASTSNTQDPLLRVEDLRVEFHTDDGLVTAVRGVDWQLRAGETLGVVGESGSGKSVTSLALMGLIPQPPGKIVSGRAIYRGKDLLKMSSKELSNIRGNRIAMIFQDPMTALNPFLTVEDQLTEVTRRHLGLSAKEATKHAIEMLEKVGIPSASKRVFEYPHQFSGGMRQRVMIAMALSCKPDILIADEPTTALDVTIQAQILELMKELQEQEGTAILMITHDLGVIANIAHRVQVMYAGRVVEKATVDELFQNPRHPYTLGLLESAPRVDQLEAELRPIPGQPPDLSKLPGGCSFRPRCPFSIANCSEVDPPLFDSPSGGGYACLVNIDEAPRHDAASQISEDQS
ncbi:ABC transporter ATP-binding protein [Blastopirellula sp. JC732]|uniref:ABC transporter ATP-binding protein n=1 Tax=Blastopirellula sediminis TaxID=2894196 RepID=A0A9X1SFB4_9BACT|nr:ABC transporter ATP-binding protein [Blastopirellula sediminis]MCC9609642.1 ABC transporter ATP-binding protein [Blastopirellula sediminis]MCC9627582.1 ABC transporter ATP-binding protein [Blastopirellula sediminis]